VAVPRRLLVVVSSLLVVGGCAGGGTVPGGAGETAGGTTTGDTAVAASSTGDSGLTALAPSPTLAADASPARAAGAGPDGAAADEAPLDGAAADEAPRDGAAAQPVLLLEAGGLGIVLGETRVEHLPFGTAAGTVRTTVTRLLGPLTTGRRTCPHGPRTVSSSTGFQLLFHGGRFVGWTDAGARDRRLTTGDGIGVGITVGALRRSGTDVIVRRTAGGTGAEWSSGRGGLDGRATSVSAQGRVTLVSSGETCPAG
jgi:hypothetical protein